MLLLLVRRGYLQVNRAMLSWLPRASMEAAKIAAVFAVLSHGLLPELPDQYGLTWVLEFGPVM